MGTELGGPQYIGKDELWGGEILEWWFSNCSSPNKKGAPTSTKTVKIHSKVEAFALTANDLKNLVPMLARAASAAKGFARAFRHLNERSIKVLPKWLSRAVQAVLGKIQDLLSHALMSKSSSLFRRSSTGLSVIEFVSCLNSEW